MQPNNPVNPYARTPQNYGGQPMQYPQMPPRVAQPGYAAPMGMPQTQQPRYQAGSVPMPTTTPALQPNADSSVNTIRMADGTVLPEVIYVKKKGAIVGFIISSLLLVACAVYAVQTTIKLNSINSEADNNSSIIAEKDKKLDEIRDALKFNSVDDLTKDNITTMLESYGGSFNVDLSGLGLSDTAYVTWLRATADRRYFVAAMNNRGKYSYYYETSKDRSWRLAFTAGPGVSCRDITKTAMQAISYVGGVDKSVSPSGTEYDCLDPDDGDKLYNFPEAIEKGIYKDN